MRPQIPLVHCPRHVDLDQSPSSDDESNNTGGESNDLNHQSQRKKRKARGQQPRNQGGSIFEGSHNSNNLTDCLPDIERIFEFRSYLDEKK